MFDLNYDYTQLTKEEVESRVSDYSIFCYYLGHDVELGSVINSPLRKNDSNPSFSVFRARTGKILYKDFGTGECGDCYNLVSRMFYLSFYETLIRINIDFRLGLMYNSSKSFIPINGYFTSLSVPKEALKSPIGIKLKTTFDKYDLEYWSKYGIDTKLLNHFKVKPVKTVFYADTVIAISGQKSPIFAYLFFKDGEVMYKVYRPKAKKDEAKWLSNTNRTVLQGWDQLPNTYKVLIITKSLKDVMVLRTLGIPALAMQTENSKIKDTVIDELFSRFEHIYILQDFELAGVRGTNKLRKLYPKIKYFFIQNFKTRNNGLKDISDFREVHSLEETKQKIPQEIWDLLKET